LLTEKQHVTIIATYYSWLQRSILFKVSCNVDLKRKLRHKGFPLTTQTLKIFKPILNGLFLHFILHRGGGYFYTLFCTEERLPLTFNFLSRTCTTKIFDVIVVLTLIFLTVN